MELQINKMRIQLINLIEEYRNKGIPTYVINGILSEEVLRMKQRELAEFTVTMNDEVIKLTEELKQEKESKDGQSVPESN